MSEKITLSDFDRKSEPGDGTRSSGVPDDWKIARADELMEITRGASPRPKGDPDLFGGDIPWVKIGDVDVKRDRYTGLTEDTVTEKGADKSKLVEKGTLLVSNSGTCGYPIFAGTRSCVHDGWLIIRDYEEYLNASYFYEYINWKQNYLKSLAPGSTQMNLNTTRFGILEVNVPPLEEQRKIASVLYNVDQAIQKTDAIIEQTSRTKSGVIQQIFSEGTYRHSQSSEYKSGKYPTEWEIVRFDDLIEDTRYGTDTKSNTEGEGYPTLRIPNVVEKRITSDDLKHTPVEDDELERLKLEENDILIIRTNGNPDYVGRCAIFSERSEPYVYASYLIRIRVDKSRVRPTFIREFMNSHRGRAEMSGWIRSSAGNYNLSVGALEKFQVPVPSLSEQDDIVEKIDAVESVIQKNRRYKGKLQRIKKGLMQDLLSGKVRTTDKNIEVLDEVLQHG